MQHFEFQWQTPDGLQIFAQGWHPEVEIKAVVCLVHGQGEHSGRYSHLATALNQAGYVLFGLDLRGNGKSEGKRGHAPSYETLMDDIAHLIDEATKRFPDYPRFLYGHCMGGNLVLNYVLRRRPQLVGVIATSPLFGFSFEPHKYKVTLARIIARVWPSLCFTRGIDIATISRDPEVLQTLENDPLCHTRISAHMLISALQAAQWLVQHADQFQLPMLLMHGSADAVTSAVASREFAELVRSECTFILWEGFYHEIHNEPEKQEVFETIIGWLEEHTI